MTSEKNDILAVIPTYNNEKTLARVIGDVRRYCTDVLVVNDGVDRLDGGHTRHGGVEAVSYAPNRARATPCAGRCATPRSTATVTC